MRARFEDDEFPNWWYSPDRNVEQPPNAVEGTGTELKSVEQTEPLVPATPRKPVPIERVPGRPQVPVQYRSDPNSTAEDGLVPDSTGEFTQDELNVLGDAGIVRSPEGKWYHSDKYPDGRRMTTPVNPHTELRRLRESGTRMFS